MIEPEYLLTFNVNQFEWFYSIDEMVEFIEEFGLHDFEALHIPEAFEVELD
ncbi:hypothetical protein [Aquibacillus saliphilus]|uniref:hypothetical protein n=1 Tax=Aquibacillus saliphilus TaxID=1909422 RepID=UPI001CF039E8|nr:hypothetical protein [Aquibacillus saliphilus]